MSTRARVVVTIAIVAVLALALAGERWAWDAPRWAFWVAIIGLLAAALIVAFWVAMAVVGIIIGSIAALILVGSLLWGVIFGPAPNLGQFAAPPGATAPLGEIGPGACWPGDERPSGGQATGFASGDGPRQAGKWLRENTEAGKRLDRWYDTHRDYYLVTEVVPEWDTTEPVERTARYVERLKAVQLPAPMRVLNTFCRGADVLVWEVQVLPKGEWMFFLPGHEPGAKDVRPVDKAVCGNPQLPPPPLVTTPSPGTTTAPPPTSTPPTTTRTTPTGPTCEHGGVFPDCAKVGAPQPSGVEKPTNNPVGTVQPTAPAAKPTPLQPRPPGTTEPPQAPGATSVPHTTVPPASGAETTPPTTCVPAPGHTGC